VPGTIFRAARVWDGMADAPVLDGFVRVDGERITAVGRWAEFSESSIAGYADEAERVVDCGATTLLPGLVNAHVHLTLSASSSVLEDYLAERDKGVATLTARAIGNLRAAVAAGITTVRDCGTLNEVAFAVRAAVAKGDLIAPRVITCGSGLTTPRGHCHFFSIEVDTVEGLRSAVADQARAGADFIKVFATGGKLTPGTDPFSPQYSAEQLRAVVESAHEAGLRVAAHAHAPEGIANAVAAGVDTIEHCYFETVDGVAYDAQIVEQIAERGIVVCPTVGASPKPSDERLAANPVARQFYARLPEIRANFSKMFAAGVIFAGGSDAGVGAHRPFSGYPVDVTAMADDTQFPVGLPAVDALRAATSVAADACGLADTGRLAPGMRADLLAVEGNPLLRISDLERLRLVVCNGRVVVGPSG
jgi:imidazolonepropionase-like amidohydrolase